jgi:uncharacterized protein YigE (DUF2233 family)
MLKARTIAFLLAAATSLAAHSNGALADTRPCHAMEYERNAYTICEVDLRRHTLRLYWKRADGTPYAYLSALPRALEGDAGRLLFATNAASSLWGSMSNRDESWCMQTPSPATAIFT